MAETLFYLLSAGAIASAMGVVMARVPLFSVLSLLATFFCLSGIYLLAGFPFLAATQLLVYAGAIMVLFLFVVMLLDLGNPEELKKHEGSALSGRRVVLAAATAIALALVGIASAGFGEVQAGTGATDEHGIDHLPALAELLFSRYMLPFEAASLLLLATMIAVIVLAKRQRGAAGETRERAGWPWQKEVES